MNPKNDDIESQPLLKESLEILEDKEQNPDKARINKHTNNQENSDTRNNQEQNSMIGNRQLKIETLSNNSDRTRTLVKMIETGVSKAVENKKLENESLPFFQVIFRYASFLDKGITIFAYGLSILSGVLQPFSVVIAANVVVLYSDANSLPSDVFALGLLLVVIALIIFAASTTYHIIMEHQSVKIMNSWKLHVLQALIIQDQLWIEEHKKELGKQNLERKFESLSKIANGYMAVQINALSVTISCLFITAYVSLVLGTIIFAYFPLMFLIVGLINKFASKASRSASKAYLKCGGLADQAISSIKTVSAFGMERVEIDNYELYLDLAHEKEREQIKALSLSYSTFFFLISFYSLYTFLIGYLFVDYQIINWNNGEPFEGLDIWIIYGTVLLSIMTLFQVLSSLQTLQQGKLSASKLNYIIQSEGKKMLNDPRALGIYNRKIIKGKIEFKNIDLKLKDRQIFRQFSAFIKEGETTALVGKRNQGKSALVSLIPRLQDVEKGQVLLDGVDVKLLNLKDLRALIGFVSQEPTIFKTTLRQNLLYSNPKVKEEELIKALKIVKLYDFVENNLANGLDSDLGTDQVILTRQQKIKIELARVYLRNIRILIIDSVSYDIIEDEEIIQIVQKLKELFGNITTIIVSSHLPTLKYADQILVLDKGEITEFGNHDSILTLHPNGIYSELYSNQYYNKSTISQKSKVTSEIDMNKDNLQKKEQDIQVATISKKQQSRLKQLTSYMDTTKLWLVAGISFASGCGKIILVIVTTALFFNMLGMFGSGYQPPLQVMLLLALLLLSICTYIALYYQKYYTVEIGQEITEQFRPKLYKSILSKHIGWFDKSENSKGNLSNTLASDVNLLNVVGTERFALIIGAVGSLGSAILCSIIIAWEIAFVCILLLPLFLLTNFLYSNSKYYLCCKQKEHDSEAFDKICEAMECLTTIQFLSSQNEFAKQFVQLTKKQSNETSKKRICLGVLYGCQKFGILFIEGLIFIATAFLLSRNQIVDTTWLYTSMLVFITSLYAIQQLGIHSSSQFSTKQRVDRVFNILEEKSHLNALKMSAQFDDKREIIGEIQFKNVWFRYPTKKNDWILRDFSLTLDPNSSTAVIGDLGVARSILIQLLLRFYEPDFGVILLDGHNISTYPICKLRKIMGVVFDQPSLFNYNVRENILYGNPSATNSQLLEVARKTHILEFIYRFNEECDLENIQFSYSLMKQEMKRQKDEILRIYGEEKFWILYYSLKQLKLDEIQGKVKKMHNLIDQRKQDKIDVKLPIGFNKSCGPSGNRLSNGEKYRVAFARALIRDPKILLIESTTNKLDKDSQTFIKKIIEEATVSRAALILTTNLEEVQFCDKVVFLKDGCVVEEGTIESLKSAKDSYYNHYKVRSSGI